MPEDQFFSFGIELSGVENPLEFAIKYNETYNNIRYNVIDSFVYLGYNDAVSQTYLSALDEARNALVERMRLVFDPSGSFRVLTREDRARLERNVLSRARAVSVRTSSEISAGDLVTVEEENGMVPIRVNEISYALNMSCSCPNCRHEREHKKEIQESPVYYSAREAFQFADKMGINLRDGMIAHELYKGCLECTWYSHVFYYKECPLKKTIIKNDEDFERVKENFVRHFNKDHKDIVARKLKIKHPNKMT